MNIFLSMFLDFMRKYSMHKVTILFPFKPHQKWDEPNNGLASVLGCLVWNHDSWDDPVGLMHYVRNALWSIFIHSNSITQFIFLKFILNTFVHCLHFSNSLHSFFSRSHNGNCRFGIFDCFRYTGMRIDIFERRNVWLVKWTIYFLINSIINTLPS